MRRVLSMSALLSSLLAAPAFAATPADSQVTGQSIVISPDPDERAMIKELHEKLLQNRPADVHHMRAINDAMTRFAQAQIAIPHMVKSAETRTEKACFLGVTTSAVSATLREQLGLPKGMGLVVDYVEKDSPAAAAGLQVHDIVQKLDDQLLVNAPQLAVLVRAKKPGDTVTLTVIRAAKPVELKAKLAEKELPVLESEAPSYETWRIPGGMGGMGMAPKATWQPIDGWQKTGQSHVTVNVDGTLIQKYVDDKHDVSISREKDGKATIVVKDKAGKELYSGPYTTEEDKKKVPADVAEKLQGTQIHFGGKAFEVNLGGMEVNAKAGGGAIGSISRTDDQHIINLTLDANGKKLTVKDIQSGKMIYDGPANTDDDLKGLPKEVLEKVKNVQKNTTIELRQK